MKYSELLIPTVKEVPAEAEIPSHQLMIRAGFIRKLTSGTYTYLPLGYKVLQKIMAIVRREMNATGAQEILMPILQPMELWKQTGRDADYGPTMCKFEDRHGRENALAPTAEEVVTSLVAGEVNSYKQLPMSLYQINTKFRDEFRPRFGVLRSREFIMKDAYSFHASLESLNATYDKMYNAYRSIFGASGLKYVIVEAESGPIGGSASHEFMVPCAAGEDVILASDKGNYAANVEKCEIGRPCPAEFTWDPTDVSPTGDLEEVATPGKSTIDDVAEFLGIGSQVIIKTLLLQAVFENLDDNPLTPVQQRLRKIKYILAAVRGDHVVNMAKVLHQAGRIFAAEYARRLVSVALMNPDEAEKDGFVVGFIGPQISNQRDDVVLMLDLDVLPYKRNGKDPFWVAGANKKDFHVKHFNWVRDVPAELKTYGDIRNACDKDPSPKNDGGILRESRGIEVGHVFKLGTKYSEKLGAKFLDEKGEQHACIMGCYGIGVNRIFASAIEMDSGHDDNGCILPVSIAPFEVEIVPLNKDLPAVASEAQRIYDELRAAGADVLIDDRDARPGVKFKDADLLGIPVRIVVGEKSLKEGNVEIKRRTDAKATLIPAGQAVAQAQAMLDEMRKALA